MTALAMIISRLVEKISIAVRVDESHAADIFSIISYRQPGIVFLQ